MAEHKDLYQWSRKEAERSGELDNWLESYRENCICARAIENAISRYYTDNRLNPDGAKECIKQFGFDRVNWVLANTVQEGKEDGRYHKENKDWARGFNIPKDKDSWNYRFAVTAHPALVDLFIDQTRKEWQKLGLYDRSHCYDENMDFTGKVVVINPRSLKDEYKTPEYQLFYASTGNGCRPDAIGTKVFGQYLKDGERSWLRRSEFIGVMKLELLPDWAQEKYAALSAEKQEAQPSQTNPNDGMGEPK